MAVDENVVLGVRKNDVLGVDKNETHHQKHIIPNTSPLKTPAPPPKKQKSSHEWIARAIDENTHSSKKIIQI
jgi:hypothetical protein